MIIAKSGRSVTLHSGAGDYDDLQFEVMQHGEVMYITLQIGDSVQHLVLMNDQAHALFECLMRLMTMLKPEHTG